MGTPAPVPEKKKQSAKEPPTPNSSAASSRERELTVQLSEARFSGPIPPPSMLAQYDDIAPGLALRLVGHAEAEAQHRRSLENRMVEARIAESKANFAEARRGQVFALVITMSALMAGSYVAVSGAPWAGGILGVAGIGGIVTTFILGRNLSGQKKPSPPTSDVSGQGKSRSPAKRK